MGVDVHVIADGVSSTDPSEIPIALDRMKMAGCVVTTSDSILFQLLRGSDHEKFKQISALVKDNIGQPHHNHLLKL